MWCIFAVYCRPLNQNLNEISFFVDSMENQLNLLLHPKFLRYPKFLIGEFNNRCFNWRDSHASRELQLKLVNLIDSFRFSQLISTPTCGVHPLDLLITDSPDLLDSIHLDDAFDNLDHKIFSANIKMNYRQCSCFTCMVYHFTEENL